MFGIQPIYQGVIKKGIEVNREEIYTPITAIKMFIEENSDKTFYTLVQDDVLKDLENAKIDDVNPDYVIICDFSDKVSYDEINKVFRMIMNGAEIITSSKTLWYIDVDGHSINTGSFVRMFEAACDKEAILMGKPSTNFFEMALKRTNSKAENTLVIGDDIKTDILGAIKLNARSALVKTGVYNEEKLQKTDFKSDFVIDDINQLHKLLNI